jgi:hypothetical protein
VSLAEDLPPVRTDSWRRHRWLAPRKRTYRCSPRRMSFTTRETETATSSLDAGSGAEEGQPLIWIALSYVH